MKTLADKKKKRKGLPPLGNKDCDWYNDSQENSLLCMVRAWCYTLYFQITKQHPPYSTASYSQDLALYLRLLVEMQPKVRILHLKEKRLIHKWNELCLYEPSTIDFHIREDRYCPTLYHRNEEVYWNIIKRFILETPIIIDIILHGNEEKIKQYINNLE